MIYERLLLKHQCAFSKTPIFTEHLQWLLLTVSGFQPTALLKKRLGEKCLCEFWKIFWEHLLSEHHRMTASCFCLWTLRSFSDHLFYRTPLGNCLFHLQVQFQPPHTVNKYFTCTFQVFSTRRRRRRRRSSYWKAFLYLKSLKIIGEKVNL